DLLSELGEADGLGALVDHHVVFARDVYGAHHRARLLPDEDELLLVAHLDVELLLRLDLLRFDLTRRSRHLGVRVDAGHLCPHRSDEEERDRDQQEIDERDHVDLRIELPPAALATTADVYATHAGTPSAERARAARRPDAFTWLLE